MSNTRRWKMLARQALWDRLGTPVLACLLVTLLNLFGGYIAGLVFPGAGIMNIVLNEVFALGISVLLCLFTAGLYRLLLCMARRKEYSLGDLIWYFKNQPDRILVASFFLAVIAWVTSLPSSIYSYTMPAAATEQEYLNQMVVFLVLNLLGLLVNILVTVPFTLTYYLLCDQEDLGGVEALKKSVVLMKGHKLQYILLQISFLPWLLICLITFYLALLIVVPYMEMANVMFYRDLIGDYTNTGNPGEYEYV